MTQIITVGVDPGKSCGLSVLSDAQKLLIRQGTADLCMNDLEAILGHYHTGLDLGTVEIEIAIERFTITPQTGRRTQQTDALEITGVVDRLARVYDVPVHRQTISDVKKFAKNPLLRKLDLWTLPSEVQQPDANDANDATRHAIYRYAMSHASQFALRLKGI